jgi:DNA-binding NtrC family response regulator
MGEMLPVLVVEDEELLLSVMTAAVERGGLAAVGAKSGEEALVLLAQGRFSAVVSDLRIPGEIGGAEIFDWVEQHRPELTSRFLFVTGNAQDPHAVATLERTGAMFLEKPFRITKLTEMLKQLIEPTGAAHV